MGRLVENLGGLARVAPWCGRLGLNEPLDPRAQAPRSNRPGPGCSTRNTSLPRGSSGRRVPSNQPRSRPRRRPKRCLQSFRKSAVRYHKKECVVIETEGRGPRQFHGKIVVLINEHCAGAAEMVAQFAKENHLATLMGMKTSGRLNAHCTFKIGSDCLTVSEAQSKAAQPSNRRRKWAGEGGRRRQLERERKPDEQGRGGGSVP
jgi:hypothetical protein